MGFFCCTCGKKVRGQPNNHPCTKRKYGNQANNRIYDKSGNKGHRRPPPGWKPRNNNKYEAKESKNNVHKRCDEVFDENPSAESKLLNDLNSGANRYRERYWNSSQEKQLESTIEIVKTVPVSNTSSIRTGDDITVEFSKLSL